MIFLALSLSSSIASAELLDILNSLKSSVLISLRRVLKNVFN